MSDENTLTDFWLSLDRMNSSVLDVFYSILKQIHASGHKSVQKYLVEPLREFYPRPEKEDLDELRKNLDLQKKLKAWKRVGNVYRKMLKQAAYMPHPKQLLPILSMILLDMEAHAELRESPFAKEFLAIFKDAFFQFHKENFKNLESGFETVLEEEQARVNPEALRRKEASAELKKRLAEDASRLYREIERAYVIGNREKLTYLLAQYTGRFCNFPDAPYREEIDKIIEGMAENNPEVRKEIRDRLSVKIYQSIVNALQRKDISTAIRGIATFALTFQGETDVPYRKELDELEEKLYAFIGKNNLWDRFTEKSRA